MLLLFSMLFITVCIKAQTDCSMYHNGFYMYTDSTGDTILLHRKNKYQYEYNRKVRARTQFRVAWISDCEYTITQSLTNSKALKKFKNNVTKVVISRRDGENGYYYTCACIDDTLKKKGNFLKKITKEEFYQIFWQ